MLVERGVGIADALDPGELVVVEVGLGALGRTEVDEDGLCAPGRNLSLDLGHLIERLPAKSTSEVAKEDQQNRGLIDDFEERAA